MITKCSRFGYLLMVHYVRGSLPTDRSLTDSMNESEHTMITRFHFHEYYDYMISFS
ncbi:hypothetical protein HanIR_Chr08g0371861 [Helianthus annuus]|nr:hypothetical protein HanIR_Chr08g0371861 [Helianthus annuus]